MYFLFRIIFLTKFSFLSLHCRNIVYDTYRYKISVNRLSMFQSTGVYQQLSFGGVKSYIQIFSCQKLSTPCCSRVNHKWFRIDMEETPIVENTLERQAQTKIMEFFAYLKSSFFFFHYLFFDCVLIKKILRKFSMIPLSNRVSINFNYRQPFKKYLSIYLAAQGLHCNMQDLQLWQGNSQLQHVGSSSLIRNQTLLPLH